MALNDTELIGSNPERLLAGAIVLHEASAHAELLPEIPVLLRATLGATSVSIVFVGMDARGGEIARAVHESGTVARNGAGSGGDDWVQCLLRDRLSRRLAGNAEKTALRVDGGNLMHALCEIDGERAVAFEINSPTMFDANCPQGRAWLTAILENMARNMNQRISRPSATTLQMAKLNGLTLGEWRILLAMDSNDSEKAIAANLSLSTHTIHSHIKNVYRVLGARSRLEAISILRRAERQALLQALLQAAGAATWTPAEIEKEALAFDGWAPILAKQEELSVPGRRHPFQPHLPIKIVK
jgi:DNA-binding CsgD family transcriptional regulator